MPRIDNIEAINQEMRKMQSKLADADKGSPPRKQKPAAPRRSEHLSSGHCNGCSITPYAAFHSCPFDAVRQQQDGGLFVSAGTR